VKIGSLDLALLAAYLAGTLLLGVWMGRRPRQASDFVVGGRDAPWWIVLCSIVATETSTVTFLSIPGFGYGKDLTWLQLPLGYIAGRLLVVALLLPQYFKGSLFTAYEVLEHRFGGVTKRVASVLFLVTRTAADGLRLYLTALVLKQVAGIDLNTAVVCLGVATIVYTYLGGIRAVLWTDLVQFAVYVIGAVAALWLLGARVPGGLAQITAAAAEAGKLRVLDPSLDPTRAHTLWAGLLGGAFLSLGTHGADQMMVQRYLCARSQRQAAWALALSGPLVLVQFALFLAIGIGLFAFYSVHPPAQPFARNDEVFATFIVDEVPPGLLALMLGAVFSAAMSTISSSLNSSATAAVYDLFVPLVRPRAGAAQQLRLVRAFTALFGAAQIGVGIAGQSTTEAIVVHVLAIAGLTTGIVLGVFLLGTCTRVGQRAALIALIAGLMGMTAVYFGTSLAWPWYSMAGAVGTFAVGCAASAMRRRAASPAPSAP
jgi:SSS family transporter